MGISSDFKDDENVYRAILDIQLYDDGSVSMAALKDSRGLSVDRGYYRRDEVVIEDMKNRLEGRIAKLSVKDCKDAKTFLIYKPSAINKYHSEIHDSKHIIEISPSKIRKLCKKIQLISV